MSEKEEEFMETRSRMESLITDFYQCCQAIGIDEAGFAKDVNDAVFEATDGKVKFEEWMQ